MSWSSFLLCKPFYCYLILATKLELSVLWKVVVMSSSASQPRRHTRSVCWFTLSIAPRYRYLTKSRSARSLASYTHLESITRGSRHFPSVIRNVASCSAPLFLNSSQSKGALLLLYWLLPKRNRCPICTGRIPPHLGTVPVDAVVYVGRSVA